MKYVQARRATGVVVTEERHGGARGRNINNAGQPWKKIRRKKGVGDNRKGDPYSSNKVRVERHSG